MSNRPMCKLFAFDGNTWNYNYVQNDYHSKEIITYLSSNISSTERDVNVCIGKPWTAINILSTIWKSDFSDKI